MTIKSKIDRLEEIISELEDFRYDLKLNPVMIIYSFRDKGGDRITRQHQKVFVRENISTRLFSLDIYAGAIGQTDYFCQGREEAMALARKNRWTVIEHEFRRYVQDQIADFTGDDCG